MDSLDKFRILIVGCGGIGGYFARYVYDADKAGQLNTPYREVTFAVVDNDVVDVKNIPYQDFEEYDLMDYKAEVIGERYEWKYFIKRVETDDFFDDYDIIIAAVDNSDLRRLLYNWAEKNPDKYWIDLRSEGRTVVYYTKSKKNTLKAMLETLAETPEGGTSCQLDFELSQGIVQQGNKIIASIGSQLLLNIIRGEYSSPHFSQRF